MHRYFFSFESPKAHNTIVVLTQLISSQLHSTCSRPYIPTNVALAKQPRFFQFCPDEGSEEKKKGGEGTVFDAKLTQLILFDVLCVVCVSGCAGVACWSSLDPRVMRLIHSVINSDVACCVWCVHGFLCVWCVLRMRVLVITGVVCRGRCVFRGPSWSSATTCTTCKRNDIVFCIGRLPSECLERDREFCTSQNGERCVG